MIPQSTKITKSQMASGDPFGRFQPLSIHFKHLIIINRYFTIMINEIFEVNRAVYL